MIYHPPHHLALSLHRLGDLIMQGHVLKAWQEEKKSSLSLLTHPFYSQVDFLFPFINEVFLFQRESCQFSVGESYYNKLWPYFHINHLLHTMNQKSFDLVADLAPSETSARWLSFINASEKIGVTYDFSLQVKSLSSPNPHIEYLHSRPQSEIHFVDLFKRSLGLSFQNLPQASSDQREKLILLQTLSSDIKKNWPLSYWKNLISKLASEIPDYRLLILSSPREYITLKESLGALPSTATLITTTIRETYNLLKTAKLLVSLDTAIKHLATWTQTPILEIALGSSNPHETGAYQENAWILQSKVSCSPCRHSQNCSQKSFLCQESISVPLVLETILAKLTEEVGEEAHPANRRASFSSVKLLKLFASRGQNNFQIKVVSPTRQGGWSLKFLLNPNWELDHARRNQEPTQPYH